MRCGLTRAPAHATTGLQKTDRSAMETAPLTFFGLAEPVIRLGLFLAIFVAMALWELAEPWRRPKQGRLLRWPNNFALFAVDILAARLALPATSIGFAMWAEANGVGLLPWLGLGVVAAGVVGFILLDLLIYTQHVVFHRVPALWRLHRVHHADTELDVTSGFRFHPLEIVLSMVVRAIAVVALGVPPVAVLVFDVVLNGMALYNHSNVRLPERFERVLRWFVVTPEMHIIHHSTARRETDSNFGFNLAVWDRLFRTYSHRPAAGYGGMVIGLDEFRDASEQRIDRLLTQPFRDPAASPAPVNMAQKGS
jgi:sterol desaturase/sphingolipid hydroxylase (fatty acid hydroxylase superfamily)